MEDKEMFILQSLCQSYWSPEDVGIQGINSHVINLVIP